MQLLITYDDIQKLYLAAARPGVHLLGVRGVDDGQLEFLVRVNLGQFVPLCNDKHQLLARVTLELDLAGPEHLRLRLRDLSLDTANVPMLVRAFLSPNKLKKQLFQHIPPTQGVTTDADQQTVTFAVKLLTRGRLPVSLHFEQAAASAQGICLVGALARPT